MLPIRGRRAGLFKLIAIPVAALLAAHGVVYRRFPWEAGYRFPWVNFLTIALIMLSCWEANLWVFRRLDRTMPFHQNPLRRTGRQLLAGGLVTTLAFAIVFTSISVVVYGQLPSVTGIAIGLLICFTIATIINGIYVGLYLINAIYWQKQQTTDQLNGQLAEQQRRVMDAPAMVVSGSDNDTSRPPTAVVLPARTMNPGILIDMGSQIQQLRPDEIAYLYSSGGIVQLVRADGRKFTTSYDSLSALTNRLPADQFFQINRQCIVNLTAVRTVRDDVNRKLTITLVPARSPGQPTEEVTISRYRSAEFRNWLTRSARS